MKQTNMFILVSRYVSRHIPCIFCIVHNWQEVIAIDRCWGRNKTVEYFRSYYLIVLSWQPRCKWHFHSSFFPPPAPNIECISNAAKHDIPWRPNPTNITALAEIAWKTLIAKYFNILVATSSIVVEDGRGSKKKRKKEWFEYILLLCAQLVPF